MKKSLIFMALVMVLCFCTSSYGAEAAGHRWYVGIGGSWAIENFDTDDLEDDLQNLVDVDFDDGWGANLNIGYHVNDNFSLAFVYSYLSGFDWDKSVSATGMIDGSLVSAGASVDADLDLMTFMLEGKYAMSGNVSPYIVLGAGAMYADLDAKLKAHVGAESLSLSDSETDTQVCGKVGLGVDWWATPEVTVGLEGSYVFGFSDHDFDGAKIGIRYFNIGLGVAYHF
jgi:opacity protein-like surface antigen